MQTAPLVCTQLPKFRPSLCPHICFSFSLRSFGSEYRQEMTCISVSEARVFERLLQVHFSTAPSRLSFNRTPMSLELHWCCDVSMCRQSMAGAAVRISRWVPGCVQVVKGLGLKRSWQKKQCEGLPERAKVSLSVLEILSRQDQAASSKIATRTFRDLQAASEFYS